MSKKNTITMPVAPTFKKVENIAILTDDELFNEATRLDNELEIINSLGMNPMKWEIEICYVKNELMTRETRKNAHAKYVAMNPQVNDEDFDDEDFDDENV